MKKTILLVLLITICVSLLTGCNGADKSASLESGSDVIVESESEVTLGSESDITVKKIIELQGFSVIIPEGFEGTGGHDGVRYINAIITPVDKSQKYEIEVGYGIAATSNDYQGQMFVRGSYNNAAVVSVDTEGWKSPGSAYTFVRTNGSDSSAFTKFDESKGPSQVMGLYRDGQWLEVELRAKEGTISDYPDELYKFMSVAIDWQN